MAKPVLSTKLLRDYLLIPHGIHANIYIRELARAYQGLGLHVVLGADNLLLLELAPRWLHLHWPEEHYRWTGQGSAEHRAETFMAKLRWMKSKGTRIAWTVHNLEPHEHAGNSLDTAVYEAVIDCADILVHHCNCSIHQLESRYPSARSKRHTVSPHGHFLGYPQGIKRQEARRQLGLNSKSTIFLQFGQVRAYKGLHTMLDAFGDLDLPGKHLLVAGRYAPQSGGVSFRERARMIWLERFSPTVSMHLREIANDEVQLFMAASDVLVLTHRAGLNSGVAVLGMSFGIPVVAPDLGCIPEVLGQGLNFTYPAGNRAALVEAMRQAADADMAEVASRNREAAETWTWEGIARTVIGQLQGNA